MKTSPRHPVALASLALALFATASLAQNAWPQFRGPNGSGVHPSANPPEKFGPDQAVLWKSDVPWSPSSPIVWDNKLFLTTVVDRDLQTRAYDAHSGKLLWTRSVGVPLFESFHRNDGSPAASSPATDGKHVISYFGSFGLICHDFDGKELWRHPLPVAKSGGNFGTGTSPILAQGKVLLNRDQDQGSSFLALHVDSGKIAWESPRPEFVGGFGSPALWNNNGHLEAVLPGSIQLRGYDVATGQERWRYQGVSAITCTTPVVGDGLLFFASWAPGKADAPWPSWPAFLEANDKNKDGVVQLDELHPAGRDNMRGLDRDWDGKITSADWDILKKGAEQSENTLVAIRPGGKGDITATHAAWKFNRGLPYVPSPLYYDGRLYLVKDGGMVSSFDAPSGKSHYVQERLNALGNYYTSPVAANGRIYFASVPGKVTVIRAGGDKPEILHQVDFGDRILATPALVGNRLYLRTSKTLWAFDRNPASPANNP